MKATAHFEDIQEEIVNVIGKAKYNIYVAVAWITDQRLWKLLNKKAKDGVQVQIILVKDEININEQTDFIKFINSGGQIFWDDHHHKFCVVDVRTVITGSYNWTIKANNRLKRENIIIIEDDQNLSERFADEFKLLLKEGNQYILPTKKEIVYVEKEVVKEVISKTELKNVKINTNSTIAKFISPNVVCEKCNKALNSQNICPECKRRFKYDPRKNVYILSI
jgi:phosphatidylserine/phosphatidylglycerophosphate/cardiolipin synthase-like enzyme